MVVLAIALIDVLTPMMGNAQVLTITRADKYPTIVGTLPIEKFESAANITVPLVTSAAAGAMPTWSSAPQGQTLFTMNNMGAITSAPIVSDEKTVPLASVTATTTTPAATGSVKIKIVGNAATFVPKKVVAGLQDTPLPTGKDGKFAVSVPFNGTVTLRGGAFTTSPATAKNTLDSALESWSVTGDATVISISSDQGVLDAATGKLRCFNTSQVILKPLKAGTTVIHVTNDTDLIKDALPAATIDIAVTVTGDVNSLNVTPDAALTMNDGQVSSVQAIVSDSNQIEIPQPVVWTIGDTSIVSFTDAPDNNTVTPSANSDPSAVKFLKALKSGNTQITASVKDSTGKAITKSITILVNPVLNTVQIDSPGSVLVGQEVRLQVRLLNSAGQPVSDGKLHIPVIPPDDYISARLDPQDSTGHILLVRGIKPGDGLLTVKYTNESNTEVKGAVGIHVVTVAAFKPVRVSLDIMDDQTAGQLFGEKTSKEFYAVRVRLFNNLDQLGAQFLGQSILAYSESIEAAVTLEKRYDRRSGTSVDKSKQCQFWEKVDECDITGKFERAFENVDNTVSGDPRFRGKPQIFLLQPCQTETIFTVAQGEILRLDGPLNAYITSRNTNPQPGTPPSDAAANPAQYLWKSSNPSVATVEADSGIVLAREVGTTFVRGTDIKGAAYVAIIKVTRPNEVQAPLRTPNVTARILPNLTLDVGQSAALKALDASGEPVSTYSSPEFDVNTLPADLAAFSSEITKASTSAPLKDPIFADLIALAATFKAPVTDDFKQKLVDKLNKILASDLYSTPGYKDGKLYPAPFKSFSAAKMKKLSTRQVEELNFGLLAQLFPDLKPAGANRDLKWITLTEAVATIQQQDGATPIASNVVTAKYPGTALILALKGTEVVYGIEVDVNQPRTNDLPPSVFVDDKGDLKYMRHRFRYRPYSFEMMVNTIDARDELSNRSVVLKYANALATVASFFTTTGIWHGGNSPNIVTGFSNIAVPGFEKLFPSMKDTQRQNFVSMSMKPIEEIPFGADIARILFFPRHPFHGVIPGFEVRIGEIVTSEFNVKVAIIDKTKAATVNAAAP